MLSQEKVVFALLFLLAGDFFYLANGQLFRPRVRGDRRSPPREEIETSPLRSFRNRITTRLQNFLMGMTSQNYPLYFMLFTKKNPNLVEMELISPSNVSMSYYFDGDKDTKIIIHDYMQSAADPIITSIKDAYLNKPEGYNVILVDWGIARAQSYSLAATVTENVGKETADLLNELITDYHQLHIIGFGLGAHVAGVAGAMMKGFVGRITGLDPSISLFRRVDKYYKLDRSDARFVDIIHTDGGDNFLLATHMGDGDPLGHADFYPNMGIFQPGCPVSSIPTIEELQCSHVRSLEIFLESIQNKDGFQGCRCESWKDFANQRCDCRSPKNVVSVGEPCPKRARGRYYFLTKQVTPFGIGLRGALPLDLLPEEYINVTTTTTTRAPKRKRRTRYSNHAKAYGHYVQIPMLNIG